MKKKTTPLVIHKRITKPVSSFELTGGHSMTDPSQARTAQDMIRQIKKGLPLDPSKTPTYQQIYRGELEYPNLKRLDLVEKQELQVQIKQDIDELKSNYADLQKQLKAEKDEKRKQELTDQLAQIQRQQDLAASNPSV